MHRKESSKSATALAVAAAVWWLMFPGAAFAQQATLGGAVQSFFASVASPAIGLMVVCAYLMGLVVAASGLFKLAEAGSRSGGGGSSLGDGFARLAGGCLMVALPTLLGVGLSSIYGSAAITVGGFSAVTVGQPTPCINFTSGSSNTAALTCVAQNVAQNLVPIGVPALFLATVMVGIYLVAQGVYNVALSNSNGGRQTSKGAGVRVLVGFLICNLPALVNAIEGSLGVVGGTIGTGGYNSGSSFLSYTAPGGSGMLAQWSQLIQYIFVILVLFGAIAMWRGVLLIKASAEGSGQGGNMGKGVTHIVGGVMIANAKLTTCWVLNTFMGNGSNLGFC